MKHIHLFRTFSLLFITINFMSCSNDDKIDIAQLNGIWSIELDDPNIITESYVRYTFNTDKTCSIDNYDALSGHRKITDRKYIVSIYNQILTIYKNDMHKKEDDPYTGQYHIKKLTSKDMRLESIDERNRDIILVRVNNFYD